MARDFSLSIDRGFLVHPKTLRFCRLMGSELAFGTLIKLWAWATEAAADGDISAYDPADIEWAVGHRDGDGRCYRALCDSGFIDHDAYKPVAIHDWMEPGHTGYALVKQKTARDRWRRNKGLPVETPLVVNDTSEESTEDSARNSAGTSRESTVLHGSRFTVHGSQEKNSPPAPAIPVDGAPATALWSANDWLARFKTAFQDANKGIFYGRGAGDGRSLGTLQASLDALPTEGRIAAQLRAPLIFAEFFGDRSPKAIAEKYQFSYFVLLFNGLRTPTQPVTARDARATGPPRDIRVGTMRAEENVHLKSGVQE